MGLFLKLFCRAFSFCYALLKFHDFLWEGIFNTLEFLFGSIKLFLQLAFLLLLNIVFVLEHLQLLFVLFLSALELIVFLADLLLFFRDFLLLLFDLSFHLSAIFFLSGFVSLHGFLKVLFHFFDFFDLFFRTFSSE